jgi:hypothetical protein
MKAPVHLHQPDIHRLLAGLQRLIERTPGLPSSLEITSLSGDVQCPWPGSAAIFRLNALAALSKGNCIKESRRYAMVIRNQAVRPWNCILSMA